MSKQTLPTVSRYHPFAMFIKIPPTVPLSAGSSRNAEDQPLSRSRWGCWKRRTAFMCCRWITLGRWAEVTYEDTRLTSRTPRGEVSVVKVCVCVWHEVMSLVWGGRDCLDPDRVFRLQMRGLTYLWMNTTENCLPGLSASSAIEAVK